MENNRKAYDKIAPLYAEFEWKNKEEFDKRCEFFLPYVHEGYSILVIGCSSGREVDYFQKRGFEVVEIDFSSLLLEEAKKRVRGKFFEMDLMDMDSYFSADSFDAVYCSSALQHISENNFLAALGKIFSVSRNGGVIYFGLKEGEEGKEYLTNDFGVVRSYCLHDSKTVNAILKKAGYRIIFFGKTSNIDQKKPCWMEYVVEKNN